MQVATGGDHHWQLPMLLMVPAFHVTPATGPVILGFGDVLLPGLLGVYSRTFDLCHKLAAWHGYFWPNVFGYAVGLVLTYLALWFEVGGSQGQPALLYLVPCTLGLTLLLAWRRKHLPLMLQGTAVHAMDADETLLDVEADPADVQDAHQNRLLTDA